MFLDPEAQIFLLFSRFLVAGNQHFSWSKHSVIYTYLGLLDGSDDESDSDILEVTVVKATDKDETVTEDQVTVRAHFFSLE